MSRSPDHDPLHVRARDDLASIALGESTDPDIASHVADCDVCRHELGELGHLVELARGGSVGRGDDVPPPPAVWDRIAAQVADDSGESAGRPAERRAEVVPLAQPARRRNVGVRRALLAAAAIVAVGAAGAGGWAIGNSSDSSEPRPAAEASLVARPGTTGDAHGTVRVHSGTGGLQLDVRTFGLPAHDGFYEVWLYDPAVNRMVAVGALGTGGRGVFTVPAGMDLRSYHVVDVSAQRYNGNPAHDRSVLRGPLD